MDLQSKVKMQRTLKFYQKMPKKKVSPKNDWNLRLNINIEMKEESGLEGDVFSYKEVSVMSEITQESYPDGYIQTHGGTAVVEDLIDFEKLKDHTIRPLKIMESEIDNDD